MTAAATQSLLRYVRRADRDGHLLADGDGVTRRALCGVISTAWKSAERQSGVVRACPACNSAVGITVPAPRPIDTTPVLGHRVVGRYVVPTAVVEPGDIQTAHARIGADHRIRRGPWLASIPQPGIGEYVPDPYAQQLHASWAS